ncbi:ThuA domain-containing protein [Pedobacter sp. PAMC26386]|nr:ThuA domain-containing protein [Pedobacter sp. PAMC26386]
MKNLILLLNFILMPFLLLASDHLSGKPRILVFSKTAGFRHSSIPNGKAAILKLGKEHGFEVDTTENASYFNEASLKKYAAVIFLQTTGNILNNDQKAAFEKYIKAGGGFAGIHAATDTEYEWPWYGKLVGAYFVSHPAQQEATLNVVERSHISTKNLPAVWKRKDEWYNFRNLDSTLKVLITIDEKSYQGGINGAIHPMAWYHEYDGGRAWYTELGHTEESYTDQKYLGHLLGGIQYAIGGTRKIN